MEADFSELIFSIIIFSHFININNHYMRSRSNTISFRTIQFHRGNPESPGAKHNESEVGKDEKSKEPVEEYNDLKEEPTNENNSLEHNTAD
jgi:hypothetical protein